MGLLAGPAFAHVTIKPGEAEQGGYSTQVFQVPNETTDANTTQVEVTMPADQPIASVSVEPVPGWEINVEKGKPAKPINAHGEEISEVVTKITWSGGSIPPGYFQTFPVSMGPLPETDSLTFKAVQTYSDGEVVRWIEESTPGGEEPERPAPVLRLTKSSGDAHDTTTTTAVAATPTSVATSSDVDRAKTIGIIAAVLGALGLIVAIVALVKNSRQTS
jgi:uncharacterized protein YcnI